jgi:hypothetical protein
MRLLGVLEESEVLQCVCGQVWCRGCSGVVHWPAPCAHAKQYLERLKAEGTRRAGLQVSSSSPVLMGWCFRERCTAGGRSGDCLHSPCKVLSPLWRSDRERRWM